MINVNLQIESETDAASKVADKATGEIADLQSRLEDLKRKFTSNELDFRKADAEANAAGKDANEVEQVSCNYIAFICLIMLIIQATRDLETKFDEASRKLDQKARQSGAMKERAENLRERAQKLAENANQKLEIFQG